MVKLGVCKDLLDLRRLGLGQLQLDIDLDRCDGRERRGVDLALGDVDGQRLVLVGVEAGQQRVERRPHVSRGERAVGLAVGASSVARGGGWGARVGLAAARRPLGSVAAVVATRDGDRLCPSTVAQGAA